MADNHPVKRLQEYAGDDMAALITAM